MHAAGLRHADLPVRVVQVGGQRLHRRRGLGRRMLAAAEERLRQLGCPKINLQVRRTNTAVIDFYRRVGFREDDVVSLGKRLADHLLAG